MASFNTSGKPGYMYDETTDTWYLISGKTDVSAGYEWTGTHSFLNVVTIADVLNAKAGVNNFLNPAARDAIIPSPSAGTVCFVRQDSGGSPLNELQVYLSGSWTSPFATKTGTETLTNKTLSNSSLVSPEEVASIKGAAATGTLNIDFVTSGTHYYDVNATGNQTLNFRGNSGTTLNSMLSVGQSATIVVLIKNGATPYYPTAFQIDGVSVTPMWSGGTAPSSGNANSVDAYSFTILKTAVTPTYSVFAGAVKFA